MLGFRPTWRSPFIGINRFEVSTEENVPYGKINVRPRLLSDVKSYPEQTQRSNIGSIPGKHRFKRGGVNYKAQRLKSRGDGEYLTWTLKENVSYVTPSGAVGSFSSKTTHEKDSGWGDCGIGGSRHRTSPVEDSHAKGQTILGRKYHVLNPSGLGE